MRTGAALVVATLAILPRARAAAPIVPGFERVGATDAKAGALLLSELNCVACHQSTEAADGKRQAPNLDGVGTRLKASFFRAYLSDPQKFKPGGVMPHVFAGDADAGDKIEAISQFLASTGTAKAEAVNLKTAALGKDIYHKIGCVACHGTRDAQGKVEKATPATVKLGNLAAKYTIPGLAAFLTSPHAARPSGRMPSLLIKGDAKARAKEAIELAHYLAQPRKDPPASDDIKIDPNLVAKGRQLFASEGCANCHAMKDIKPTSPAAPALAKLKPAGGCLAEKPAKGLPWYELSAAQRTALGAAIQAPPAAPKAPAEVVARTMAAFNCYACHSRDKLGGPEDDLNKAFLTLQPEMGDEARLPPALDGVGAKIKPEYLQQIFNAGSMDRPYMVTRMPAFGLQHLAPLLPALLEADKDKFPAAPKVAFEESEAKIKGIGRHLVGARAFSCYKCHTFAGQKAEGTQGIDMTLFPARLTPAWFHAYLYDPQKIRPGTRMPSAFDKGKSPLSDILDGTAAAQSEAMWRYLLDGKSAQLPEGFSKKAIPLVAVKDAVMLRTFIKGAGPRAIGVGFPERINLAFDANDCRLALIWQGGFIDGAKQWEGRGGGFEPPLGDNVLSLPAGPAFAVLQKPDDPWPVGPAKGLGFKFAGYQLSPDDRPTFLYTLGDVAIEDFPTGVSAKNVGIRRVINMTAGKSLDNLYFRAAAGKKIDDLGNGQYRVDGVLRMKITSQTSPIVRPAAKGMELIVPVSFINNKARVMQELDW